GGAARRGAGAAARLRPARAGARPRRLAARRRAPRRAAARPLAIPGTRRSGARRPGARAMNDDRKPRRRLTLLLGGVLAWARALRLDRKEKKKVLQRLRMSDRNFVWLARKVTDGEAAALEALSLPGVAFVEEPKRFYPKGPLAAHVLGYVGLDNDGLAGLEQ